ncbi:helix-turn-helix transcriptional regulator [Anaerococcus sp.]|uniref:helix-turn-helix domain-containing protein n=1 Tax=Anaerococcus sp. TaxID=1872515 RepID=UPI00280A86E3|nr:helix-turn-helix transcriptional regulator [Anaerococcus sp.]MDU2599026.1 helix-turn-helix transcriptional regulator [Anaerococcus sp.]MDU3176694.1 helix-turn-helix transcriptional regulator [Anaerococcus sp.]
MIIQNDYSFIGSDIRKIRESKGITRKEIAEKMFISEETIRRIEKGDNDPRISTLVPICNYIGLDLKDIINHEVNEYNNLLSLRKEINYLLNNSSVEKAKDLINKLDSIDAKSNINFEKELYATKHYFNGILSLEDGQKKNNPSEELEVALSDINSRFKVNKFKDYKYDEFSLRILLALSISEYKKGNMDLYRDIMMEISKYLDPELENYFILCYNVAIFYFRAGKHQESLKVCDIAICNAKKVKETYCLNMIYYIKGINHLNLEQIKEARESFNYCLALTNIFSEDKLAKSLSIQVEKAMSGYK